MVSFKVRQAKNKKHEPMQKGPHSLPISPTLLPSRITTHAALKASGKYTPCKDVHIELRSSFQIHLIFFWHIVTATTTSATTIIECSLSNATDYNVLLNERNEVWIWPDLHMLTQIFLVRHSSTFKEHTSYFQTLRWKLWDFNQVPSVFLSTYYTEGSIAVLKLDHKCASC